MENTSAAVIFKDTDAQGGVEISVEGVPGSSPLNGVAAKIYDVAQGFAALDGIFGDPEGAMDECRITISEANGAIKFSYDFGKGISDDAPVSLSQQLLLKIADEMSKHIRHHP